MIIGLLQLLIVAIVLGLIWWIATQLPFLAPFANIIKVVVVVIFVIYLIYFLMAFMGHVSIR